MAAKWFNSLDTNSRLDSETSDVSIWQKKKCWFTWKRIRLINKNIVKWRHIKQDWETYIFALKLIGSFLFLSCFMFVPKSTAGRRIWFIHGTALRLLDCPLFIMKILVKIGVLLPKLFWPTVRKKNSSVWEKLLKFEAEGQEFEKKIAITRTIYSSSERSEQFLVKL